MNAYLLSLNPKANISDQWDFGFLKDFLIDNDFTISNVKKLPKIDTAIVVLPARHHKDMEYLVNKQLANIKHVVLFLMGDEEADFVADLISHPSIHIWVQNPHMDIHDNYNRIGTGYPQHIHENVPKTMPDKDVDVFFAGQVTHQRRVELIEGLNRVKHKYKINIVETNGFTKGESKKDYYKHMSESRIAPAPSGAVVPDSFRLFEALECMSVVIADSKTPDGRVLEYWDWLFNEITPFLRTSDWGVLRDFIPEILDDYTNRLHKQTAWWIMWKRNFKYKVLEQLND
jgi:hypothetical protein